MCGGDGFVEVSFTVTFLGLGDRALLLVRNRSESSEGDIHLDSQDLEALGISSEDIEESGSMPKAQSNVA